jgi:hypothetical protein
MHNLKTLKQNRAQTNKTVNSTATAVKFQWRFFCLTTTRTIPTSQLKDGPSTWFAHTAKSYRRKKAESELPQTG